MPVKVGTTSTSLNDGNITSDAFELMISEFKNNTDVTAKNGRNPIIRKEAWYVTREEVMELFNLNADANGKLPILLEINFAINLEGLEDVCGNPMGDSLTVVLRATTETKVPVNESEEFVLIPGFNNATVGLSTTKSIFGTGCCPSSRP